MKKFIRNFKDQQNINKHLFCSICHEVFRRPVIIACGHTFCKHCIQLWKVNHKFCPNCRQTIQKKDNLLKNLIPQQIIDELDMNCASEECKWTGKLQDLEKHYSQCQFFQKIKQSETNPDTTKAITIEEELSAADGSDVEIVEVKNLKSSSKVQQGIQNQNSKIGIQKVIAKPKQKSLLNKMQAQRKSFNNYRIKSQSVSSSQLESESENKSNSSDEHEDSFSDFQKYEKHQQENDQGVMEEEQDEINLIKDVRKKVIKISYEKQEVPKSKLSNNIEQSMEIEMQQKEIQALQDKPLNLSDDEDENSIKDIEDIFSKIQERNKKQSDEIIQNQKKDNFDNNLDKNFHESLNDQISHNQINPQNLYDNLKQNIQLDDMEKCYSSYLQKFSSSKQDKDKNDQDNLNSDYKHKQQEENMIIDNPVIPFSCVSPNNSNKNQHDDEDGNLIKSVDLKQPVQQSQNYLKSSSKNIQEDQNLNVNQFSPQKFQEEQLLLQNSNNKLNPDQKDQSLEIQNDHSALKQNEQIENIEQGNQDGQQISSEQSKQQEKQQEPIQIDNQLNNGSNLNQNNNNSDLEQNKIFQEKQVDVVNKEIEQQQEYQNGNLENDDEEEEESKCNRVGKIQQQEMNYQLQNVDYKQYAGQKVINEQNHLIQEKNEQSAQKMKENQNNKQEGEQQKKKNPIIDILFGFWKN
ncbi:zinc finger, C3HC4 type (RING finger) protein (macronuclear) [Tetrahymena thermophila SB210]|uniref:Zinc finger, C3HC4 type (RING finger) protein n=1 Tax=Tetrahymena thermophila (strain SB210) TaxID=312017 RepID=Q22AN4_TETTS|nr:zinc finger, C3HC4 type (RING finger) protein [Tetrahymena thermophila SB210]EAR82360.2 zinc finger, C3HC4 type (RING finger) protein [Tetrahymena thermophila SB210]|eukprot:XP_001030023.2 zinc finger, C3HC4 type (RING finger) protein [Tetrahymena thermophila SB210]